MVLVARWGRDGAAGGVGEAGDAQRDGAVAAGGDLVHFRELDAGAVEADLQALGLAEPAAGFSFRDTDDQVVTDLLETGPCGGVRTQERTAQTAVLMDAGGVVGTAAVADADSVLYGRTDAWLTKAGIHARHTVDSHNLADVGQIVATGPAFTFVAVSSGQSRKAFAGEPVVRLPLVDAKLRINTDVVWETARDKPGDVVHDLVAALSLTDVS